MTDIEEMFDCIASLGFNSDYLFELSICECWIMYMNQIEKNEINNYLQNPCDKNGNEKPYKQIYIWQS